MQRPDPNLSDSDDLAVATIGQLKHFSAKAIDELNDELPPPGAGPELNALLDGWRANQPPPDEDKAALAIGQLKYIGKLFYDRLNDAGASLSYPWTAYTSDDDPLALAVLGQIKQVFAFDASMAFPPPNPAEASQIPLHFGILLRWTGVKYATGYRIERRLPLAGAPLNQWALRAEVGAGDFQLGDLPLATNTMYAYRVFAKRGALMSAPSSEVSAYVSATPPPQYDNDSDGDGTLDEDEDTNLDTDADGTQDYLDTDDDGDGSPDVFDHFPKDRRLNGPVAYDYYTAFSLNNSLTSPVSVQWDLISIDDQNRIAWTGYWSSGQTHTHSGSAPEDLSLTTVSWHDGVATVGPYRAIFIDAEYHGYSHHFALSPNFFEGGGGGGGGIGQNNSGDAITHLPFWMVISDIMPGDILGDSTGFSGVISLSLSSVIQEPTDIPDPSDPVITLLRVGLDGSSALQSSIFEVDVEGEEPTETFDDVLKIDSAEVDSNHVTQPFGSTDFSGVSYAVAAMSRNRSAVWSKSIASQSNSPIVTQYMRNGATNDNTGLPWTFPIENCRAVNDEMVAVGTTKYLVPDDPATPENESHVEGEEDFTLPRNPNDDPTDPNVEMGRGELGFIWDPSKPEPERLQVFHELLPPEYKARFHSAVPFLITNRDGNGDILVHFKASVLEDIEPDLWKADIFSMRIPQTGDAEIWRHALMSADELNIIAANQSGVCAALGTGVLPLPGGGGDPSVEYQARWLPKRAEIHLGYDPPLWGDGIDDVQGAPTHELEAKIFHTSLATKGDQSENKHLEIAIGGNLANQHILANTATGLFTVAAPAGLVGEMTITAKSGVAQNVIPVSGIVNLVPINDSQHPVAQLVVDVLPTRTIDLGIWFVEDKRHPLTIIPPGYAMPTPDEICNALNEVFKQAAIHFCLRKLGNKPCKLPGMPEEPKEPKEPVDPIAALQFHYLDIPYDIDGDSLLDSGRKDHQEFEFLKNRKYPSTDSDKKAKLNLIILHNVKDSSDHIEFGKLAGVYAGEDSVGEIANGIDKSFVFAANLPTGTGIAGVARWRERVYAACAHEIGHALGLCSRGRTAHPPHSPYPPHPPLLNKSTAWKRKAFHDIGYFPEQVFQQVNGYTVNPGRARLAGLMWPQMPGENVAEWRWLRWEDWVEASNQADLKHFLVNP